MRKNKEQSGLRERIANQDTSELCVSSGGVVQCSAVQKSVNRLQIGTVLIEPHLRHTFFGRQCSTKKSSADYGGGGVGHHRHCDTGPLGRHRHRYLPISIIIEQNGGGSFLSFFLSFIFFLYFCALFPSFLITHFLSFLLGCTILPSVQ